jgi:hypothetical protein
MRKRKRKGIIEVDQCENEPLRLPRNISKGAVSIFKSWSAWCAIFGFPIGCKVWVGLCDAGSCNIVARSRDMCWSNEPRYDTASAAACCAGPVGGVKAETGDWAGLMTTEGEWGESACAAIGTSDPLNEKGIAPMSTGMADIPWNGHVAANAALGLLAHKSCIAAMYIRDIVTGSVRMSEPIGGGGFWAKPTGEPKPNAAFGELVGGN